MEKKFIQTYLGITNVICQQWGKQRFVIEIDEQGVRIYEVHASGPKEGERIEEDGRGVWIDPHEMTNKLQQRDILLVHAYNKQDEEGESQEGVPVTLSLDACDIVLTNDGNGTLLANEGVGVKIKCAKE